MLGDGKRKGEMNSECSLCQKAKTQGSFRTACVGDSRALACGGLSGTRMWDKKGGSLKERGEGRVGGANPTQTLKFHNGVMESGMAVMRFLILNKEPELTQMQKNGQISVSSLNGKTDEHTDFNGLSEDKTLSEANTRMRVHVHITPRPSRTEAFLIRPMLLPTGECEACPLASHQPRTDSSHSALPGGRHRVRSHISTKEGGSRDSRKDRGVDREVGTQESERESFAHRKICPNVWDNNFNSLYLVPHLLLWEEDGVQNFVGQTDATPQKEDSPETIEVLQDEVSPQVNGEQEESECVKADKTTAIEETVVEEKPNEANEVGFKKIFRFVGFKFTLKKDKNEKTEPVQLLTVKETEDGASEAVAVESKEETVEVKSEEENISVAPQTEEEVTIKDTADAEAATDLPQTDAPAETTTDGAAAPEQTPTEQPAEDMTTAPEKESEVQAESPTSPGSQEMQSSFKRFFTQGIFSNLRKKTSFKKPKEEEPMKEKSVEEDIKETDEKPGEVAAEKEQVKDDIEEVAADKQVDKVEAPDEVKDEGSPEEAPSNTEEPKEEEPKVQATAANETEAPPEAEPVAQTTTCEDADTLIAGAEEQQSPEKSPAEATTEAEVLSTQEKVKAQGSPLKKLFTGAGLKKLSKKQKGKKEAEVKVPESGEQAAEQIQPSTEPAESQKPDSSPSSSEESGEHVVEETPQSEAADAVTPKKHVKRSSESEDETSGDKPKSATLSSTESAVLDDKPEEMKPSDEVNEEPKEESQIESKTETKAEKAEQSTEEPKRKMDTSVSWEALICVGSAKKRARKTLDSDDEETKIDEEVQQSGEEQPKTAESPLTSSQEAERENVASSSEPEGELVSTWESFKRLVTHRKKPKAEEKSDEASAPEQAIRKKKSAKQGQVSSDIGSAEEDSDTPAVVPLSEYDNEQPEKAVADEDIEDEARGKQLSDIPEEGDTAATPKSTDNTIAEDIVDFTSEAVTALEPVEETEMVSAMSREAVETSAVEDENVVLVVCEKSEATALSTGLKISEIKGVEEESPLKASVESVTAVGKAGSMEITVKEQTLKPEEAGVTQDTVFEVRVNEVQTEYKEETQVSVENAVEMTAEAIKETSKTETVDEFQQATAVKVAVAEGPVEPTVEESVCAHTVQVTETTVSEDNTPVAASGEESAVTEEIIFVSPDSKTEGELKDESTKKDVPALVTTSASSNISAVVEERCEKVEEEEVIQNVVENLGDLNIKQLPGETPVGVKNDVPAAQIAVPDEKASEDVPVHEEKYAPLDGRVEIKAQEEEDPTVSTDARQEGTDVIMQEIKLGEVEKIVEDEKTVDTPASEASTSKESYETREVAIVVSRMEEQVLEEQCQQDMKGQEGHGDALCQHADAEASEAKVAVEENAIKEEMDHISTETATSI
ncbi:hypothetical protein P4O66_001098 [Electrophorus voltai]|uniref:A kinase-anchoring proteins AKAP-5 and AKAP-12 calmodulin (CaM)-binding domain-containing protein n=1 Tax=Electrophorus voltai TaxID=2609070 RepID=A0AAD9DY15_9TELE|nr:hypothetical protein P4O66_001098 [Electrophorus voltai]